MRRTSIVLFLLAMATATVSSQSFEREAFLDAEGRFLSKNYALALERYDEFLRSWPDSRYVADARYRRAVALYRLGRADEAYEGLGLVESRFRSTKYLPYVPFWKAVIEYDRGDLSTAGARFEAIIENPPDAATLRQSLLYFGKTSTALGNIDAAKIAFESLIEKLSVPPAKPEDEPTALIFLADLYVKDGEYERLVALWEKIDPAALGEEVRERVTLRAAEAYSALGRSDAAMPLFERLSSSSRRDIATAALQRMLTEARRANDESSVSAILVKAENALRSDPDELADFWLRVGSIAFGDGRFDLAESYFLRISALLPAERVSPDVPIYLAEIAAKKGNVKEAYEILAAAAPYAGKREALLKTRLGRYALDLSRWEDARSALADAVAALGRTAVEGDEALAKAASSYYAYALHRCGQDAAGLDALEFSAAKGVAQIADVARLRAELLRRTDRAAESLEAFEAIIAVRPADAEARIARMSLLFEKGRFDRVTEADIEFDKAIAAGVPASLLIQERYLAGISFAAIGNYVSALSRLDSSLGADYVNAKALEAAAPWAVYYRSWALYRLSRFAEAKAGFDRFLKDYPKHPQAYSAAYLASWSAAGMADYRAAAVSARLASDLSVQPPAGEDPAEAFARAAYLEGTLRPFFSDWEGALAALNRAVAARTAAPDSKPTSYTVKAAFERGVVLDHAGRVDEADAAFALVSKNYPLDPAASEAAYRRGELLYRAGRKQQAIDRFSEYRQSYPNGDRTDAALYFGGLALKSIGKSDAGILLWERLLQDHKTSRYRFPAIFAAARAYREKQDWEASFRAYTQAIAEFGDLARKAGAGEEAETLRYLLAKLPEKAARLHTILNKEGGATTRAGRTAALELARFYITESAQREAGLPLIEEVTALRSEDPAAAAEGFLLKGDYFALLENWDRAAAAYLDAVSAAADAPAGAKTTAGASIKADSAPEALFKAAQARYRSGKTEGAAEVADTLLKNYPTSTWTAQAKRFLEDKR